MKITNKKIIFLIYNRGTTLSIRDEPVDYFGILLSGRALVSIKNKIFGFMEMGDMIGYVIF